MVHRHETDENADRAPQEVGHCESDRDILLAIDGARRLLESVGVSQQRCDLDFLPVFLASAAKTIIFTKFLRDRLDLSRTEGINLAA